MRALSLTVLALSACSAASPPPPPQPSYPVKGESSGALCHGRDLAAFAGQPATRELGARMLAASGARALRWVPEGGAVTMDFRADRLTVYLTQANSVERASCG